MSSHSSSRKVLTESIVSFLEQIPPFQFLPIAEIRALTRTMTLEYFPKDTVILAAGRQVSEALYIVQKGAVDIRTNVGKKLVLDMRSEGEVFGLLSLMGRDVARLERFVADLNDRVIAMTLKLAEEKLGPPPLPCCWVVLGSEGRREQTFKTDQDNDLLYGDPPDELQTRANEYFEALAVFAQQALERCEYPPCPGGWMASNPTLADTRRITRSMMPSSPRGYGKSCWRN